MRARLDHFHCMIDPFFTPRLFALATPPAARANWALFLDLDGTLLDIAPTPDAVAVPGDLVHDLSIAARKLDGALAIVSGRLLSEIDALLAPLKPAGAGEHGAVVRLPSGQYDEIDAKVPPDWVDVLIDAARDKLGVLIERKTHSVVAHYRNAPKHEEFFRTLCASLINDHVGAYEILQAKMALEIRPRTVTKARAVNRLMQTAPFEGRVPVFIGDDATDYDGFRACAKLGGEGIDVFERFAGRPQEVRLWLKTFANL